MPHTVAKCLPDVPRKMLSAGLRPDANADRKPLTEHAFRAVIGGAIECALLGSRITKQEASHRMGYDNQASISKWISGVETPQFAKLWAIGPDFRAHLVIALARACDGVDVTTQITIRDQKAVGQ